MKSEQRIYDAELRLRGAKFSFCILLPFPLASHLSPHILVPKPNNKAVILNGVFLFILESICLFVCIKVVKYYRTEGGNDKVNVDKTKWRGQKEVVAKAKGRNLLLWINNINQNSLCTHKMV